MNAAADTLDDSVEARLSKAKALVQALQQGDEEEADRILDELGQVRQSLLFQQIGRLTRQLHDALSGFMVDSRLTELTESEMPDARERLQYVIDMTEQAANTTLNVVDKVLPMISELDAKTVSLTQRWRRFLQREMPFEEFKELSHDISIFLLDLNDGLKTAKNQLNEVLLAQSFQDLTGQIIRRVIDLVQQVEDSLIELIRFSAGPGGVRHSKVRLEQCDVRQVKAQGPVIPAVEKAESFGNQDDVDDLLSRLGF